MTVIANLAFYQLSYAGLQEGVEKNLPFIAAAI